MNPLRVALCLGLCLTACPAPVPDPLPAPDAGAVEPVLDAGTPAVTCDTPTGLSRAQTIEVGGQTRHYLLYVPKSYACAQTAVLFDFHGAYGGDDPAEEVYTLQGAIDAADREGFILVRPRSMTTPLQGRQWHYWDTTAADVASNLQLTHALLDHVAARFAVDPARVYALGFSNGTQMALRLLAESPPIIRGAAIVGGGYWSPFTLPASLADRGPLYVVTGYRDLHYTLAVTPLETALRTHDYPMQRYFARESMAGHELLPWHYPEAFAWLDRGEAPADGPLPSGWVAAPMAARSALAVSSAGEPWVFGGLGTAWRGADDLPALPAGLPVTGICATPTGTIIATANNRLARLPIGAPSWTLAPLPPSADAVVAMAIDVLCLPSGRVIAGGFSGYASDDDGATWAPLFMGYPGYGGAQVNRLLRLASGRVVAAGDYYLGASATGASFDLVSSTEARYLALASFGSTVWAAGTSGVLAKSIDDGATWSTSVIGAGDVDVYDLLALSATHVVAVGARGAMRVSNDGGATWATVETGTPRMLTAIRPAGADVTVFGERGFAARLAAP